MKTAWRNRSRRSGERSIVEHGFLDTGGGFTQLDVPGATFTSASGINDAGQIVGSFGIGTSLHGFLDTGGSFTQIDVPDATLTDVRGINDAGQIVGSFDTSRGTHGFLDTGGSFTQLDVPGQSLSLTFANGINDAGQIVGLGLAHSFLYTGGSFALLDVPGGTGTVAFGINDAGQIVGGFDNNTHGFLATPVPEPATLTVLSVGLILTGLGMMRRRAIASERH
jgi:probable HAF family extracellular repeat protein